MGKDTGKRVLVATRIHLPEPSAASFRWDAVEKALLEAGFTVEVLTSTYPLATDASPQALSAVKVRRWPVLRDKQGNLRGYLPYMSFDVPLFFRLLCAKRPDIVMAEPPPTTGFMVRIACAIRGVPYVWYAADTWTQGAKAAGAPALVVQALGFIESFAVRGAAAAIVVTEGVERRVREMGGKRVAFVPNGIDTSIYSLGATEGAASALAQFDLHYPYFIYAGTASEFQGATIFLDALRELLRDQPELQVVFVGSGADWPKLQAQAEQINRDYPDYPRAVIADQQDPHVVAELLANSVAGLVSISPEQGGDTPYPTKILATLSTGRKVIYVGGGPPATDLQQESMGWVCRYDVQEVAKAMREALAAEPTPAAERERLHRWTEENRSTLKTGRMVTEVVQRITGRQAAQR